MKYHQSAKKVINALKWQKHVRLKCERFFTLIIVDWQVQYLQLLCFNADKKNRISILF